MPLLSWLRPRNPSCHGLTGSIDGVFSWKLSGWVYGGDERRLSVVVRKNGALIGECLANVARPDLAQLRIGDGGHGFLMALPADFSVRPGDAVEMTDAADPARKLVLRITPQVFDATMGLARVAPQRISGWAYLPWQPRTVATVQLLRDGKLLAETPAGRYLDGVPGAGSGRIGFTLDLPMVEDASAILPRLVLRCAQTGRSIPLAPARSLNPASQGTPGKRAMEERAPAQSIQSTQSTDSAASAAINELLKTENDRLRSVVAEQQAQIEMNLVQLRRVQEELEHWFQQTRR